MSKECPKFPVMYSMSIVKKSGLWMMLIKGTLHKEVKHNYIKFEVTYEGPPNYLKTYFVYISGVLMIVKCSLEIDLFMSKPLNINLSFL